MNALRATVSGLRVRYMEDGFDLDLTYITPRFIAMSYPASGVEKTYRNDIYEVANFLNSHHPNAYRVYNLSDRSYDYDMFNGRVGEYGFPNRHPPPLQLLIDIINDMVEWTAKAPENVLVVHSLTGKGRVGLVCSCYLLFTGHYGNVSLLSDDGVQDLVNSVIRDFKEVRGVGVRWPSQVLYIYYFIQVLLQHGRGSTQIPLLIPAKKVLLRSIELNGILIPSLILDKSQAPLLQVLPAPSQNQQPPLIYHSCSSKQMITATRNKGFSHGAIFYTVNAAIQGDLLIRCLLNSSTGFLSTIPTAEVFHFTFNTKFLNDGSNTYRLPMSNLDEVVENEQFPSKFQVVCHVKILDSDESQFGRDSSGSSSIDGNTTEDSVEEHEELCQHRLATPSRQQKKQNENEKSVNIHPVDRYGARAESLVTFPNQEFNKRPAPPKLSLTSEESNDPIMMQFSNFEMCEQMEETRGMCENVLARLQGIQTTIAEKKGAISPPVAREINAIQTRFRTFLVKYHQDTAFERLVSARTVIGLLREFHLAIDSVETKFSVGATEDNQLSWMETWKEERKSVEVQFIRLWEINPMGILDSLPDQKSQENALLLLTREISSNRYTYRDLLQAVKQRVKNLSGASVPEVPGWFIPNHEVQRERCHFARGSFGKVYRGTWQDKKVVIKCVDVASAKDERDFSREARVWLRAQHPNVVRFYGACHLTRPCFFVCEEATNGSLADFLNKNKGSSKALTWSLLRDAALGLQFLHHNNIVHGDLKCNQILVSEDLSAKLTDFGMSFVSLESRPATTSGAVRWKAPELLTNEGCAPTFASDVYSFGMCVVEAVSGSVPWRNALPNIAVVFHLTHGTFVARPEAFKSDEQWEFVLALCSFEPSERLSLSTAILQIDQFTRQEQLQALQDG